MSGVGFDPSHPVELARMAAAIFLTGCVVKLMDDFLDLRYDAIDGYEGLASRLGEGTLPYSLVVFAVAALMHPRTAIALLLGAYLVGMAGDARRLLPSGLPGYQEALVVSIIGVVLLGWSDVLWAAAVMFAVQAVDDIVDYRTDRITRNPNLVRLLGAVELHLAGLIAVAIGAFLRPVGTAWVFIVLPFVLIVDQRLARPMPRTRGWGL